MFDKIAQNQETLCKRIDQLAFDDEYFLAAQAKLCVEISEPLSASMTYFQEAGSADVANKLADEMKNMKRDLVELEKFLDDKWKEWDEVKKSEDETFEQLVHGLEDSGRGDPNLDEFKKASKSIRDFESQAYVAMKECFEVR